jgi:hypothetical protein
MEKIKEFKLSETQNGKIEVAVIEEPYGKGTDRVASIGIFLDASNREPDWKVHIPKDNIDEVMDALKDAKERI